MKVLKLLPILTATSFSISCNNGDLKPKVRYNGYTTTKEGDTINRYDEKGKQGHWVFPKANGSHRDTVYKDGVAISN